MALSTQESDEDRQYILVAKMDSARSMTTALKAIHFKDVRVTDLEVLLFSVGTGS